MNRPTKKPPTLTDQIKGMEKNQFPLFFPGGKINSVKAIASRIAGTSKPMRKYVTEQGFDQKKGTPGIWVWRLR